MGVEGAEVEDIEGEEEGDIAEEPVEEEGEEEGISPDADFSDDPYFDLTDEEKEQAGYDEEGLEEDSPEARSITKDFLMALGYSKEEAQYIMVAKNYSDDEDDFPSYDEWIKSREEEEGEEDIRDILPEDEESPEGEEEAVVSEEGEESPTEEEIDESPEQPEEEIEEEKEEVIKKPKEEPKKKPATPKKKTSSPKKKEDEEEFRRKIIEKFILGDKK